MTLFETFSTLFVVANRTTYQSPPSSRPKTANQFNQLLTMRILEKKGHHVVVVGNGIKAVEALATSQFDVVLMDVQMPRLDGYGATSMLRTEGSLVPIIALTAHALREDRERALTQGFTNYLTKPLNALLLVQTLSEYRS